MKPEQTNLSNKAFHTRQSIISAARIVIAESGVPGINVMSVCAKAGVGRTSFYNYFTDADELIASVAVIAVDQIKEQFDQQHDAFPRGLLRLESCLKMILSLAIIETETVLLITALAQTTPKVFEILETEIGKELSAEPTCAEGNLESLGSFLAISTLGLARQLAEKRIPENAIDYHLNFLMKACNP